MKRAAKQLACLGVCMVLLLAGCAREPAVEVVLDVEETAYQLSQAAQFEITYNADASFLANSYGFDEETVGGYKALFGTMLDANRVALFEVPNKEQKKAVLAVVDKIHAQLKTSFSADMTDQIAQAEAAQTVEKGNYILFISGANAQAGVDAFAALFEPTAEAPPTSDLPPTD